MLEAQHAGSGQELDFTQKLTGIGAKLGQHFVIFAAILLPELGLEKRFHHFFHQFHHAAWLLDSTLDATDLLWICH